jgi:hypothetical protein
MIEMQGNKSCGIFLNKKPFRNTFTFDLPWRQVMSGVRANMRIILT